MTHTTTPTIDGKKIITYHQVITADVIIGANIISDIFAGIRDIVGGRSATYEKKFAEGKALAIKELEEQAASVGANAIVGIGRAAYLELRQALRLDEIVAVQEKKRGRQRGVGHPLGDPDVGALKIARDRPRRVLGGVRQTGELARKQQNVAIIRSPL